MKLKNVKENIINYMLLILSLGIFLLSLRLIRLILILSFSMITFKAYSQDPDSIWRREYQRQIYKKIDSLRKNGYLKGKIPRERKFYMN